VIPQVSSLVTVVFGYHLTVFRSPFFARFSAMPAATPPRPPKAIQDIIDGIVEHGAEGLWRLDLTVLTPTGKKLVVLHGNFNRKN
jgi:hypothetical protein